MLRTVPILFCRCLKKSQENRKSGNTNRQCWLKDPSTTPPWWVKTSTSFSGSSLYLEAERGPWDRGCENVCWKEQSHGILSYFDHRQNYREGLNLIIILYKERKTPVKNGEDWHELQTTKFKNIRLNFSTGNTSQMNGCDESSKILVFSCLKSLVGPPSAVNYYYWTIKVLVFNDF